MQRIALAVILPILFWSLVAIHDIFDRRLLQIIQFEAETTYAPLCYFC